MLKTRRNIYLSTILILLVSFSFALLVGSGLYGYGTDYYSAYNMPNLAWGGLFNRLGWGISTLTINGFHIGVHLVTLILSLSAGFLIREHIKFKNTYSIFLFLLIYLISIHTWPIIMSTSNAMRQGIAMSLIFLAFVAGSRKSFFWMFFFSLMSIFMHGTGLLLFMIVIFAYFVNYFLTNYSFKNKIFINFLIGICLFISAYYFLSLVTLSGISEPSRIIRGDFRWAFLSIGAIYIALSFVNRSFLSSTFNLSLYYFSFIAPTLFMNGLNWQYERLGMMMLIPYILAFGSILNRASYTIYLIIIYVALLFLTIQMGMYASLE